jgi:hypothetical protein
MFKVTWPEIKSLVTSKRLNLQYLENDTTYKLWILEGSMPIICELSKNPSDTTHLDDFVNNYKASCNKPSVTNTLNVGIREAHNHRARLKGIINNASAPVNTTTYFYWTIPQLTWLGVNKQSYFDGVQFFTVDSSAGDTISLSVTDASDNVLETFCEDWNVFPNTLEEVKLYKARLYPGYKLRIAYTNSSATNVAKISVNIFRHLDELT